MILPTLMHVSGFHPNDVTDERLLAPIPQPEMGRILDADYYRELDARLADRMAARGMGQWLLGNIDYRLFNDSTSPLIAAGSDNWLYSVPDLETDCDELEAISLPDAPGVATDRLRFAIVAPKAAVHPEPHGSLRECEIEARSTWAVKAVADERYVDLNSPLLATRDEDPEADMFYRRATSWSPTGRLVVAETLIESIAPGLWNENAVRPRPGSPFPENLMTEIGIDSTATLDDHSVKGQGNLLELDKIRDPRVSDVWLVKVTEMTDNTRVIEGTTLLVGDDQLSYVLPYIDQYFERLVFVHWDRIETDVDLSSYEPDRVIVSVSEPRAAAAFSSAAFQEIVRVAAADAAG